MKNFLFRFFAALAFVIGEAIVFAAAVFVVIWIYNTVVTERFPSLQQVPFKLGIAFGILAGLIRTGLNSYFQRKGIK